MSADVLRRAAALMRERALDATGGAWSAYDGTAAPTHVRSRWTDDQGRRCTQVVAEAHAARSESQAQDAVHIASWHPAVALAVADWLDGLVDAMTNPDAPNSGVSTDREEHHALAVARAYIQEQP